MGNHASTCLSGGSAAECPGQRPNQQMRLVATQGGSGAAGGDSIAEAPTGAASMQQAAKLLLADEARSRSLPAIPLCSVDTARKPADPLHLGADALPLSVTICSTEDLQVVYQNHGSLAYAGDQRGVSQLSGASRSFLMQLLSLQPPEMVEEVMAALDKGEGPWVRVIQVPSHLVAPKVLNPSASSAGSHATVASPSYTMPMCQDTIDAFGFNTISLSENPHAMDSLLASKQIMMSSADSGDSPRARKERRPSSWLAQQLAPSTTLSGEESRKNSKTTPGISPSASEGTLVDPSSTATINNAIPEIGSRTDNGTGLGFMGLPAAASASTTNTRNRLAKLLSTANSGLDSVAAEDALELDMRVDTNLPKLAKGSTTEATSRETKESPCWHEVTITPFTNPGADQKLFIVAQADVTARCQLEQRLMKMMEAQLFMLESMFPRHVLERIAHMGTCGQPNKDAELGSTPGPLQPHKMTALCKGMGQMTHYHECVTIMFTDICGFTTMSERVEPQQVMTFLNSLFSKFDELVIKHKVFKVETAGDCYIIVGGLMEEDDDGVYFSGTSGPCVIHIRGGFNALADKQSVSHARAAKRALDFAAEMLEVASTFTMPDGQPVRQRVGLHTGPVVSGLIGNLLPKFSLFGDTMNTASRMESTSIPGRIQVSEATHKLLQDAPECWECTGGVEVKGKGLMSTYLLKESAVLNGAFPCSLEVTANPNPSWKFPKLQDCTEDNHVDGKSPCNIDMDPGGFPLRLPFAALESVSRASYNRLVHTNRYAPSVEEDRPSPFPISPAHLLSRFNTVMQARFSLTTAPDLVEVTAALPTLDLKGSNSVPQLAHMVPLLDSLVDTQSHMGLLINALMSDSSGSAQHEDCDANAGSGSKLVCSNNLSSDTYASYGNRVPYSGSFTSGAYTTLNSKMLYSGNNANSSGDLPKGGTPSQQGWDAVASPHSFAPAKFTGSLENFRT